MISRLSTCVLLGSVSLLLGVHDVTAQNPNIGTAGAKFLKIPVGARASAMAGASVASIDDASAVFWNPAGIVGVKSTALLVSYTPWWATTKLSSAVIVASLQDVGSIGVSVTSLTMDKMAVTTEQEPEGTGEFFDAGDLMIGFTYARRLTEDFSVGITAKYVNQRIWNETANGWAFDIGTQYRIGFRDLTLAMSMTNFGPDMTFDGRDLSVTYDPNPNIPGNRLTPARLAPEEYPLPLHFQIGISMTVLNTDEVKVLLAADAAHPNDNSERVNVGTEVTVLNQIFLRGGYRFGYDTERATFGAGVGVPLGGSTVTFDYSYALYDLLPNVHRVSLGVSF